MLNIDKQRRVRQPEDFTLDIVSESSRKILISSNSPAPKSERVTTVLEPSKKFNTEQPPVIPVDEKEIKNKLYYVLLILSISIPNLYFAFNENSTPPIIHTLSEDFEWAESERPFLLSLCTTAPNIGFLIASYTASIIFGNTKPSRILRVGKILTALFLCTSLIKNTYIFIGSKFLTGLTLGYITPTALDLIYQVVPKSQRSRTNSIFVIFYSVGLILCFSLSAPINEGLMSWKQFYMIFAGLAIIDALVSNLYLSKNTSPTYMVSKNLTEQMSITLSKYLMPAAAKELLTEAEDNYRARKGKRNETEVGVKTAYSNKAAKRPNFFQKYKPELIKSVVIPLIFNLCFFNVFGIYSIFMITEDMSDEHELAKSAFYLSIASIVDISLKLILASFNLVKYRKRSMIIGLVLFSMAQFSNGYFQLNGMWDYCKFVPIFAFSAIGGISLNAYFPWMAEFFSGKLIGIVNANNLFIWIVYGLVLPNLDPKKDNNKNIHYFSFTFAVGSLFAAAGIYFFGYETYGKSRTYFYNKLRGLNTVDSEQMKEGKKEDSFEFQSKRKISISSNKSGSS